MGIDLMAAGVNLDMSLIICTRDRCQQLVRCLQAVQDIWLERSWELIIVDNGSTDHTVDVVHDFIRKTGIRAVYLFEPKLGKSIGLNAALRVAHGQILIFEPPQLKTSGHVWPAVFPRTRRRTLFSKRSNEVISIT